MKFNELVHIKIQHLYNDLQLLEDGHFYEHDTVPGTPSYQRLAARMKENLAAIEKAIKEVEEQ